MKKTTLGIILMSMIGMVAILGAVFILSSNNNNMFLLLEADNPNNGDGEVENPLDRKIYIENATYEEYPTFTQVDAFCFDLQKSESVVKITFYIECNFSEPNGDLDWFVGLNGTVKYFGGTLDDGAPTANAYKTYIDLDVGMYEVTTDIGVNNFPASLDCDVYISLKVEIL